MVPGLRVDELVRYAMSLRHTSARESHGLCFQATLALAQEALRLGLDGRVDFVRWRVSRDVNFLEHWALVLDDHRVLDMTAIQVDGNPEAVRSLASYPANYSRPRQYPAALVLAVMQPHVPNAHSHFSRRLIWVLHRRLFGFDADKAWRARALMAGLDALSELARRGGTLCTGYLLERAIARMSRILIRME